ncbi:MAG: sulfite exporter TauE/SafE family protein [Bacteroidetes bacterium]|nr:MAG: sulfite exporter TauE/SafE family protein [Bacteroidota bacterium]TAG87773.1 MAG: sulfite exporter TauE/SafE family protein [Bacteroidota bacterium]
MEYLGYFLSFLVGISLGLVGSGGSILMIPILVYLMQIPAHIATTYSLFIVGVSSLIGSYQGIKSKILEYKIVLYFGIPSIIFIFLMRKYVMPILPDNVIIFLGIIITKNNLIMLVFSVVMIFASFSMIKIKLPEKLETEKKINLKNIFFKGILVGILSGFVGVGGGFLIIPTLVFSAKLEMKKAVATSLAIISFNALIGFVGSLGNVNMDWLFLSRFTFFAVVGILVGIYLSKKISNEHLKPAFGWFILIIGIYIMIQETILSSFIH